VETAFPLDLFKAITSVSTTASTNPLISIVIVNYKVPEFITQAIRSIKAAELSAETEIIVVDNASEDRSAEIVTGEFPDVTFISLKANNGFGKACNIGAKQSRGTYLLLLNPDALISRNTLAVCRNYLDAHTDVGILGPKIINPDGSLQAGCRRSFPTPFNSFCRLFGISWIFPRSKRLSTYNLKNIDAGCSMEVDAISGSFMFMRLSLFTEIGGFDEAFFMYGEDLDLCAKAREKGYRVWYHPETQIIHFKAKSSGKNSLRAKLAFYEAMVLFSRKYRHSYGAFFPGWLLSIGIGIQAVIHIGSVVARAGLACFIDLILINLLLWASFVVRFYDDPQRSPYTSDLAFLMIVMHSLISIIFVATYTVRKIYSSERYTPIRALIAGLTASLLFVAGVFFIKAFAFSRIVFALSSVVISLALVAWREILPRLTAGISRLTYSTGQVIVVGNSAVARRIIENTERDTTAVIRGVIWPVNESVPGDFDGYPVLGSIRDIGPILDKNHADLLLIATTESWHSHLIEALATFHLRNLTIKWVKPEMLKGDPDVLPEIIPLQNFSV
jgi:GT2 family glycosyltransferase